LNQLIKNPLREQWGISSLIKVTKMQNKSNQNQAPLQRIVRLTVWNLDGTTSEMKFYFPALFCNNMDDTNSAGRHLAEWCREMTRYYLKISHYKIDFGTVLTDGTEQIGAISFEKQNIPEGKIFKAGKIETGQWMTPQKLKESQKPVHVRVKKQNKIKVSLSQADVIISPLKPIQLL
jgi:hypothetical protein